MPWSLSCFRTHGEPLPTIPKFQEGVLTQQLPRCTECTNLPSMQWMCAQLRTFLLLAVALMVAAHPLARSLSTSHLLANEFGPEVQVVICTSHGPVVLDDPSGMPQPAKQDTPCPWCAVEGGMAGKLLASAGAQIGVLEPPKLLPRVCPGVQFGLRPTSANWPAHAPRGPPSSLLGT
jgi:hypothetical protein